MKKIKALAAWRPGRLAWNVAHTGGWNGVRVALQAANLILLARAFGPEIYGALSGTVAFFITVAQFVGFGAGIALVRDVSRGDDAHARLGSTQVLYFASAVLLLSLAWPLSIWWFGAHLSAGVLLLLAVGEILITPAIAPLACRFQAAERLGITSALLTLAPVARCATVACLIAFDVRSLAVYATLYAVSLLALVLAACLRLWPRNVRLNLSVAAMRAEMREGLPFSVSSATATASGEVDKSLMLRLAGELTTGQYTAASRVAQAAVMPVQALMVSIAPRWFRAHAQGGAPHQRRLAFGIAAAYAAIASAGCWVCAPFLPWLLGSGFEASAPLLRLFSGAIVTGSLRQVTMMMTMTSDLQALRNVIELAALVVFAISMIVLIPRHGATGAVVSVMLADGLAILLGAAALTRAR